jgi:hypothetical protein
MLAAILAASLGACSSQSASRFVAANAVPSGATVAFESIDGPPPEVFRKLVTTLNDEAGARNIAVVSRNSGATYRVRGYVSAAVERNGTTFDWVWDVYDADKRRTLRISGEEPAVASRRSRDAWSAADDAVLRRMARSGMEKIAAFLNSPEPPPPATAPETPLPTLVAGRDDSPEGAGIFRLISAPDSPQTGDQDPPTGSTASEPEAGPPPPAKPRRRKTAAAATPPVTDGRSAAR